MSLYVSPQSPFQLAQKAPMAQAAPSVIPAMNADHFVRSNARPASILFSGTEEEKKIYRFGTSGWRSIEEFTPDAVRQITNAFADYLVDEAERTGKLKPVLIGGDTREKTAMAIPIITEIMKERGFDVYQVKGDVPTPVLAYAAKYFNKIVPSEAGAQGGFLLTASHNPWEYGGFNFVTSDGAIIPDSMSKQIEALQANPTNRRLTLADRKRLGGNDIGEPQVKSFDPYKIYKDHLINGLKIDFNAIRQSGLSIHYDPLYATGRNYLPRILKETAGVTAHTIHDSEQRPVGYTGMPDPAGKQLDELSENVKKDSAKLKIGLANDGDADRFGVLDENGRYVTPNEVILLIMYHLIKNKQQRGVVARNIATTTMLDALAKKHGLPVVETPVGYKYIAEEFERHAKHPEGPQILIGGESSGGLSVIGHLPEKDGIMADLLIAELVATEKRPLSEILQGVKDSLDDQHAFREATVTTPHGKAITSYFQDLQRKGGNIGGLEIDAQKSEERAQNLEKHHGTRDGAKIWFKDGSWMGTRPSGTEPMLRLYMETVGKTEKEALDKRQKLIQALQQMLAKDFDVKPGDLHEKAT